MNTSQPDSVTFENSVTFEDIATDELTGIDYRRAESPEREAILDEFKQKPVFTVADITKTPLFSRGVPGVAILDYDGDHDLDMYVTNGPGAPNSLYSNQLQETGELKFIDVAEEAGVAATDRDSTGVSYGDIDNDGDQDLLVTGAGEPNLLFENQGDGTFIDITEKSQIEGGNKYSSSTAMGDVNGDGLLDIVVANSFDWNSIAAIGDEPFALNEHNQLFLNNGDNTFTDVSTTSGIQKLKGFSEGSPEGAATITWAISMVDYDLDGDLDIIHADDQGAVAPEELGGVDRGFIHVLQNDGTGQFTDVTPDINLDQPGAWMGLSFGDFNSDGNLDIFGSNFGDYAATSLPTPFSEPSRWFLGQDDGTFSDPGVGELETTPFGWGTSTTDYDNDGDTDIIFQGGQDLATLVDASNPGAVLQNDGNANFTYDENALANAADHTRRNNKGLAVGDLNNDGFDDLVSSSNFDFPEPIPLESYSLESGSPFDETASFVPTFVPTENPGEFVPSGLELPDGSLSVEINSADNGNGSIGVQTIGTAGFVDEGKVNRDGIGAVVSFTPDNSETVMKPILGGSSFVSQDSLAVNFGLGTESKGTVEILWPGGTRNRLYDVDAGEKIVFPEIPVSFDGDFNNSQEYRSSVEAAITQLVETDILTASEGERFLSSSLRAFAEENPDLANLENESFIPSLNLETDTQSVSVEDLSPTVSVLWDKAVQQAVIDAPVGPTIGSRAYAMVHTAIFDAWAAYDPTAIATQLGDDLQRPEAENTEANKTEAMSYAAYSVLTELFPEETVIFDELMHQLGYDPSNISTDTSTAAGIGNISAEALLQFRSQDGSNQLGIDPNGTLGVPYSDNSGYQPANPAGDPTSIDHWTPENVPIDAEPGTEARTQQFLTPQWGDVRPFALESGEQFRPEAPQPFLLVDGEVDLEAKTITLQDTGEVLHISKDLIGEVINPEFIQQAEEVVHISANLTDEQKLVAEFWEDGGGTSFPPGTWMTFGQAISERDDHTLDEDAQLFFSLGNAEFDAGIATWEAKTHYDYTRPVRAVRELGELGLIGEFDSALGGYAIDAWGGPGEGTERILATDFITYQTPGGDSSPPFSEYTSGHSAFSAAGAEILQSFTGSDKFDAEITFESGDSRFEPGVIPHETTTLTWETFSEAADEAGTSRLYGGIHFEDGDLNGRTLGGEVGQEVWEQAQFFIQGGEQYDSSFI